MTVIRPPAPAPPAPLGWCAAIGMFDGVHLGHQHVVQSVRNEAATFGAAAAVVTFEPHPLSVVQPDRAPKLLQSPAQRLRSLESLGVDAALVVSFDGQRAAQSAEDFIAWLQAALPRLRSISVGQGFHFGRGRAGNVPLLRALGARHGFRVNAVAPLAIAGEIVSSSAVRAFVRAGNLRKSAEFLGRPYTLAGGVIHGDHLATKLGFPTANLDVGALELPPNGVYAAVAKLASGDRLAAVNIGRRPTVAGAEGALRVEAHLLEFSGELYGQNLELVLARRLRDERRFPDLAALKDQIGRDVDAVRAAFR